MTTPWSTPDGRSTTSGEPTPVAPLTPAVPYGAGSYGDGSYGGYGGASAPHVTTTSHDAVGGAPDPGLDPFHVSAPDGRLRTPTHAPGAQYQQPMGYAAYGPAPVWAAPPRNDPMAIAALVLGICSIVLFPILLPQIALVLGLVSLRRIRTTGESGKGMAITGVVIGGAITALTVVLVALFIGMGTA